MNNPFNSGLMFGFGLAAALCFSIAILAFITGSKDRDDSDPPGGRSGVSVVTDHKTSLQYLKAPGGGITPRLTVTGEHMKEADQ